MKIGIFAKTFAGVAALPILQAVRDAGYQTTQFNMACLGLATMPDEITDEHCRTIAAASVATDVTIAAISGTYNMIHPDVNIRAGGLRRLGVLMTMANAMGTPMITLCTGTRDAEDQWRHHPDNTTPEAWHDLTVEMQKALALAEQYRCDLGIEPELANVVSGAEHAHRLIREMKSQRLRVILDPANLFEVETDTRRKDIISHAVDLLGPHIAMAHAKDRDGRGNFVAAGKGVIDFKHFTSRLKQVGFDGPLVTHGLAEHEAVGVAAFLRATLAS